MNTLAFALLAAFLLPISAFAWGCSGPCGAPASSFSFSSTQHVTVHASTFPAVSAPPPPPPVFVKPVPVIQPIPVVVEEVYWDCDWSCGYDPQWVHDPWTGTWY